jgi:tRNA pseudouridine38-40 synthase
MRHKLRLELQWLGTHYCGWQAQPGVPGPLSIYEVLHAALKEATGQDGGPVPAGRTDKGVHAMQQAVTVTVRGPPRADTGGGGDDDAGAGDGEGASSPAATAVRRAELEALVARLNALLPPDVRALSAADAPPSAHALTDAVRKTYSYFIIAGPSAPERCAAWGVACWLLPSAVDLRAMALAAEALTGHHDFRSFTSTQDPRRDTHRTIEAVRVRACEHYAFPLLGGFCAAAPGAPQPPASSPYYGACWGGDGGGGGGVSGGGGGASGGGAAAAPPQLIQLQFVGEGFLKHQVRRMVGLLVRIGLGKEGEPEAVRAALDEPAAFDRRRAPTAPAEGLWLESVQLR